VVVTALAILDPWPQLRPGSEIATKAEAPPGVSREYQDSYRRALLWVLGDFNTCPGSQTAWSAGLPEPGLVDVEHQLLVGRVYSQALDEILNQQVSAGGEAALWWALGRG
jgi:hypothetical protein